MNTYLIDPRNNNGNSGETFYVEAADYGEAAKKAAEIIFDGSRGHTQRDTGDRDGSGMFSLWEHDRTPEFRMSRIGHAFHVLEM